MSIRFGLYSEASKALRELGILSPCGSFGVVIHALKESKSSHHLRIGVQWSTIIGLAVLEGHWAPSCLGVQEGWHCLD